MAENKTKIINLKKKDTDADMSQLKKNKSKRSTIVDTGKEHSVSVHQDFESNKLENLLGIEYKNKYRNPFKRIFRIINEEELNDTTSEALVRLFGIIAGIAMIVIIIVFLTSYHIFFSSYSANYKKAEESLQRGDFETATRYFDNAFDKTSNHVKQVKALKELIKISEIKEMDLNVKSYLVQLISITPEDEEAVLKLKDLYLKDNDIEAVFDLAYEIKDYKTSELLYDVIKNQPVFSYKSGTYDEAISVSISSDENCSVYYTLDGAEADVNSILFTEPIQIDKLGKTTIHAVSVNSSGVVSDDYSVEYNIISNEIDAPNVFPKSGTFDAQTEILIDVPSGYDAYYTLDGSEPDSNSMVYKSGLTIPYGNHIFTVKFINANGNESESVSRVYIFEADYKIDLNEAYYSLKSALINANILTKSDDEVYDSMNYIPDFECTNIITLNDEEFYLIKMTDSYFGESEYAVHVDNGAVFKLSKDKSGSYYLSAVE